MIIKRNREGEELREREKKNPNQYINIHGIFSLSASRVDYCNNKNNNNISSSIMLLGGVGWDECVCV